MGAVCQVCFRETPPEPVCEHMDRRHAEATAAAIKAADAFLSAPMGVQRDALALNPDLRRRLESYFSVNSPEPDPVRNSQPPVWPMVIVDMNRRDHEGRAKYGTPLQPFNGRDPLIDAYQEALDLVVYLRQAIYERDGR